jgi:hypothetical protein
VLTAGLRFNKTLPLNVHNIMSLGYVDTIPIAMFYPPGSPALKSEHAARFNTFLDVAPMALLQPSFSITQRSAAEQRDVVWDSERSWTFD